MKRLLLLCCLLSFTGESLCVSDTKFEIYGLPDEVKAGDVLPPLTMPTAIESVTMSLKDVHLDGPDLPLFGTLTKLVDDAGVTFDDLIIPSTGTYTLFAKVSDSKQGNGSVKVNVTTRHFAEITCQEDGSVIGAASTQIPWPTIVGDRFCRLTRGGGEPVPANLGTVRCDFLGVSASCTAPRGNCFDRGPMMPIPFGTSVSASWSGGEVPEGSATAVRPQAVDAGLPPSMHPRSQPLRLTFEGAGEGTVRLVVMQQTTSTVSIDCLVPVSAGVVEVPASLLSLMQPGPANVLLDVSGRTRMPSGEFDTTLVVPGPVINGYLDAVPLTLE